MTTAISGAQPKPKRKRKWTEADLLDLPDDGRKYELVRGRLKEVPTGGRHGWLCSLLSARIHLLHLDWSYTFDSSTGFRMRGGNIRSPDVSVMRKDRLPEGKPPAGFIEGAPDLAIEIVSPSEDQKDLLEKVGEYFEAGAQEVWLLFPERKQAYRYRAPLEVEVLQAHDTLMGGDLLPGFAVRVEELLEE